MFSLGFRKVSMTKMLRIKKNNFINNFNIYIYIYITPKKLIKFLF